MNEQEMRKLDADMHRICGWAFDASRKCWHRNGFWTAEPDLYHSDRAAAMEVLEKCKDVCVQHRINKDDEWCVGTLAGELFSTANTLPMAICKFAKQLFSKRPDTLKE